MENPEREIPWSGIREQDVLSGRGKALHYHKGNVGYRNLVRERARQYQSQESTAWKRTGLAQEVLQSVDDIGGRFLLPGDHGESWVECPHRLALIKVKQALRDMKILDDTKRSDPTGGRQEESSSHHSPRKRSKGNVRPHHSEPVELSSAPKPSDDLSTIQKHGAEILPARAQEQARSNPDNEAAFDSGGEEFCHGRRHEGRSGRNNVACPVGFGGQSNFLFPSSSYTFFQPFSLQRELEAYPSIPVSNLASSREKASLDITYMELLQSQGPSASSRLDRETIDILRRLQQS